jgi:hypothetical protein
LEKIKLAEDCCEPEANETKDFCAFAIRFPVFCGGEEHDPADCFQKHGNEDANNVVPEVDEFECGETIDANDNGYEPNEVFCNEDNLLKERVIMVVFYRLQ